MTWWQVLIGLGEAAIAFWVTSWLTHPRHRAERLAFFTHPGSREAIRRRAHCTKDRGLYCHCTECKRQRANRVEAGKPPPPPVRAAQRKVINNMVERLVTNGIVTTGEARTHYLADPKSDTPWAPVPEDLPVNLTMEDCGKAFKMADGSYMVWNGDRYYTFGNQGMSAADEQAHELMNQRRCDSTRRELMNQRVAQTAEQLAGMWSIPGPLYGEVTDDWGSSEVVK